MEQIIEGVQFIKDLVQASPLSLGIKAGLILLITICFWYWRSKIFAFLKAVAQQKNAEDAARDEARIGEENERDNRELDQAQQSSEDWADQERKKDQKP